MTTSKQVMKAIVKGGHKSYFALSGGSWDIFSRTFGWFQVQESLTEEQRKEVEKLFKDEALAHFGTRDGIL
jgi:hypothetical protein